MVGRRCVVTGASSGVGLQIARNLSHFGAYVILGCRDQNRGSAVLQRLVDETKNDRLSLLLVDLSDQTSIHRFAKNLIAGGDIHVLVNCAGIISPIRELTIDGIEHTWALNVMAPFLLSHLLADHMSNSTDARIINVASGFAHSLDLNDSQFESRPYDGLTAYAQSKQALRMLTWELAKRYAGRVQAHSCTPGAIQSRLLDGLGGVRGQLLRTFARMFLPPPSRGAITPTFLSASPHLNGPSGAFWRRRRSTRCKFRSSLDVEMLWDHCSTMVQQRPLTSLWTKCHATG